MLSNHKQIEYWTNSAGKLWVKQKIEKDHMLKPLGDLALSKSCISSGMHVLDIGCGTGQSTNKIAELVGQVGHVSGLDLSKTMIDGAKKLIKKNISFAVQDIENDKLKNEIYDSAFSRFGVMFFSQPSKAFKNIYNSLKENALLTFICWQRQTQNPWYNLGLDVVKKYVNIPITDEFSPGPFAYANKNYLYNILNSCGYKNIEFFDYEKNIQIYKGYTLETAIIEYIDSTPLFNEKVKLLNKIDKEKIFLEIKVAWRPFYKKKYLLFPSKTWVVRCRKY